MSEDKRFANFLKTPLFRGKTGKKGGTLKDDISVDDRFRGAVESKSDKTVKVVDQYGRKVKNKNSIDAKERKDLEKFYGSNINQQGEKNNESKQKYDSRLEYLNLIARGEIDIDDASDSENESEDDAESSVEDEEVEVLTKPFGEVRDAEVKVMDASFSDTNRLAIKNCDWENISARDLLIILESFLPTGKVVKSVTVYVSDFGRKAMDDEEKFGPRSIWKKSPQDTEVDDANNGDVESGESDADSIASSDQSDIYDYISDEDEEADEEDSEDDEEEGEEEGGALPGKGGSKAKRGRGAAKGDFKRSGERDKSVGLVFHQDLVRLGKAKPDGLASSDADSQRGGTIGGGELDEQALREYELRKLKYYFAIAECDSADTAAALYQQLDGTELEHSSMTLDLSFVPDDLTFEGRETRDRALGGEGARAASVADYKPPEFVLDALQHSKVKCSWDKGDAERERKLTNFSKWRDLNESELQQYIASASESDSDSDNSGRNGQEDKLDEKIQKGKNSKKIQQLQAEVEARQKLKAARKKRKAEQLRKSLLGAGFQDDENSEIEKDDFFASGSENEGDVMKDDDSDANNDDGDDVREMSYFPADGEDERGADSESVEDNLVTTSKKDDLKKKKNKKNQRKGKRPLADEEEQHSEEEGEVLRKRQAQLELLFDGHDEQSADNRDFNMRDIVKSQKLQQAAEDGKPKKKKGKKGKKASVEDSELAVAGDFQLDLGDDRFRRLFEDPQFGIDLTNPEFKATPAMQDVLGEQTKRRRKKPERAMNSERVEPDNGLVSDSLDVSHLVTKLKRRLHTISK